MLVKDDIIAAATKRLDRRVEIPSMKPLRAPIELSAARLLRVRNYVDSARAPQDTAAYERAIGTNDLLGVNYLWQGIKAARAVARILVAPVPRDPGGSATGFMVAPNLMMTNWHVFEDAETARRARAQFSYEADQDGNERVTTWFSFVPDQFFVNDEHLDYCIVAIDPASQQGPEKLGSFGWLRLNPELGKADYGQFLSIIQHPDGDPKQIAIRENKLLPFDETDDFLTYQSDTFRGSSGSPVLNDFWDVVALHHSGKPLRDKDGNYVGHDGQPIIGRVPSESEIQWIANEGGRVSRIVAHVVSGNPTGLHAENLLASFTGSLDTSGAKVSQSAVPTELVLERGPVSTEIAAADRFTITLPLDVSLKVERLHSEPTRPSPLTTASALPLVTQQTKAPLGAELARLVFDSNYDDRAGYNEAFLGRSRTAPMPTIDPKASDDVAPTKSRGKVLHYHHYSAVIHARFRMPLLTACNADYTGAQRDERDRDDFGKDAWITDPRMDEKYQLTRGFYDRWKKIDYGHLVRRDDNCWGASEQEITYANSDTFHLTNCTPQHEEFNRAIMNFHGLWGGLENLIGKEAASDASLGRLSIFAGPIFTDKDLVLEDKSGLVHVPLSFWKVVIAPGAGGELQAFGFTVSQQKDLADTPPYEEFKPTGFETHQVSLSKIEGETIVRFDKSLKQIDVMIDHPKGVDEMEIATADEVWLGRR